MRYPAVMLLIAASLSACGDVIIGPVDPACAGDRDDRKGPVATRVAELSAEREGSPGASGLWPFY